MIQAKNHIAVVGSLNMDVIVRVERLPAPGETILGEDVVFAPGGKGANQAVSAGLAGASAHMVACVGTDLFSELVTDGLSDAGV